ncbi:MAG: fimbrillin family protein [Bacteroidaceae bacterium]|nr:fimbrillin family protein [Bacteroidaceae bacterium]
MKTNNKYIALAALVLGFTACTQEEIAPQQSDIVKIASACIATEAETRVNTLGDGASFEDGDQILVVSSSRDTKNKGTYTLNSSAWSLTEGVLLYAASGTNNFTAYYPATESFTFPTDQSDETKIKSADRMTATATGVEKGGAVELSFAHQNAKVTITPSLASEFTGKTISAMTIQGVKPYANSSTYTAILEPSANGFSVALTIDGQNLTATSTQALEAGKKYSFTLTVGKNAATVGVTSVADWGNGSVLPDGVAEEDKDYDYDESTNVYEVCTGDAFRTAIANAQTTGTAQKPATIKMMKGFEFNIELQEQISIMNGVITIDLNGKTIYMNKESGPILKIGDDQKNTTANANVTITDNTIYAQGQLMCSTDDIAIANYSTLIVDKVLLGNYYVSENSYTIANYGSLTINGGKLYYSHYGIYTAKNTNLPDPSLTINGGTIYGPENASKAIVVHDGSANIKGGIIKGGRYDLDVYEENLSSTKILSFDENGVGATFTKGISSYGGNISNYLADGAAFYNENGEIVVPTVDDYGNSVIEGTVIVKKIQ